MRHGDRRTPPLSVLTVSTDDGYDPGLEAILGFVVKP
jgi:hypothetical protein